MSLSRFLSDCFLLLSLLIQVLSIAGGQIALFQYEFAISAYRFVITAK